MLFEEWLVKQKYRDDPIGDLANDFISTGCEEIEESFKGRNPCMAALEAYDDARAEFLKYLV